MKTITIKTVKRASGYQARYELDGAAPVRYTTIWPRSGARAEPPDAATPRPAAASRRGRR